MNRKMEGLKKESPSVLTCLIQENQVFCNSALFFFPFNLRKKEENNERKDKGGRISTVVLLVKKVNLLHCHRLPTLCLLPLYLKRNPWDHSKPWK